VTSVFRLRRMDPRVADVEGAPDAAADRIGARGVRPAATIHAPSPTFVPDPACLVKVNDADPAQSRLPQPCVSGVVLRSHYGLRFAPIQFEAWL
jgi:hypothetical protein